ncbi:hypothetical protein ACKI14_46340 [Streptomyces turgidiscabies]|uniref:hypothetical protein n=1 Tax=Streptomyces turgidiscabies TaxID=85558 RepID=UPI0038F80FE4
MSDGDWYAQLAAGWAERQRREDEKWAIPEGGAFITHCARWVDAYSRACPQGRHHPGPCGLPPDDGPSCRRDCPDGECYCPAPGETPINPACGHLRSAMCGTGCGNCTHCVGCYCAEIGPFWVLM